LPAYSKEFLNMRDSDLARKTIAKSISIRTYEIFILSEREYSRVFLTALFCIVSRHFFGDAFVEEDGLRRSQDDGCDMGGWRVAGSSPG
jgi:hypothetical protein